MYQVIESHLRQYPSEARNFPNFDRKRKPILARGSAGPLEGELHSAEYFHGRYDTFSLHPIYQPSAHGAYRDGLGDITPRHPEISTGDQSDINPYLEMTNRSGVDVALDILRSRPPRSVTYIALGPLTNLALMMRKDSKLVTERIGRIICMGGALDVPGNTTPMAECMPHFLLLQVFKRLTGISSQFLCRSICSQRTLNIYPSASRSPTESIRIITSRYHDTS